MIKLKHLILEYFSTNTERFREPLIRYLKNTFREYDDRQLLMFGMTINGLIEAFLEKILSIQIYYDFSKGGLPTGTYDGENNFIEIEGIDNVKYCTTVGYQRYVDSIIFHELIHAINFHKKLWDRVAYDTLMPTDKYYGDPEEIRAYRAQIKDFLMAHLGLSRKRAEGLMNKYSTDRSARREKWISRYHDIRESLEYNLATGEDLQAYRGMAGWKGKIIWMPPDKFLGLAYPLPDYEKEDESSKSLEKKMLGGYPLDFLVLRIDSKRKKVLGHEGRHRATVAKKLGIKEVPVLVYFEEGYPRVPKWGKAEHDFADKAEFKPEWDKT